MTFSIFSGTGNLVDAFDDRAAALCCLADLAQVDAETAFLVTQDDRGVIIGEILFASDVPRSER